MVNESVEDYLGAIYRLREERSIPLPLSRVTEYFGFSKVSIHEMIQRMEEQGLVTYQPYHGVTLTEEGETVATALLRRHRLWERFLTDLLDIPWDKSHEIACQLEHAAPETVTERLATLLGQPKQCPHGGPIPPYSRKMPGETLNTVAADDCEHKVIRISPELPEVLKVLHDLEIGPGSHLRILKQVEQQTLIELHGDTIELPQHVSQTIWVTPI